MTRTSKRMLTVAAVGAGLVVVAACGSSGGSGGNDNSTVNQPQSSTSTGKTIVTVQHTALGDVLADTKGNSLYLLTADSASHLACTGACLSIWQPLLLPPGTATPKGSGVSGQLGTVSRGTAKQVTVSGHPLYTYSADVSPRQTTGQGVQSYGGTWWVVSPSGAAITTSGGAAPSPTNAYGY